MTPDALSAGDLAVDRELSSVAESFRFLPDLTPLHLAEARQQFAADRRTPRFEYPDLEDDPGVAIKQLKDIPVGNVEDAELATLLLAKQRELLLQMQMLLCRDSPEFLSLSVELYGAVSQELLARAEEVLAELPTSRSEGPWIGAAEVVDAVNAELDRYRSTGVELTTRVEIREGTTGVMVSNGDVLVAPTARIAAARLDALLAHEVSTHVLTYVNGMHQPVRILGSGLAGHDETQEGLAVFAEYLVGRLTPGRLRVLASRVVAVHELVVGTPFPDVHRRLTDSGISEAQAFTTTTRVFRSGGLTKDAIYLRGLIDLIDYVGDGGDLQLLWLGKMPLTAAPLVAELHRRGALDDALVLPHFLAAPSLHDRLDNIDVGQALSSLLTGAP